MVYSKIPSSHSFEISDKYVFYYRRRYVSFAFKILGFFFHLVRFDNNKVNQLLYSSNKYGMTIGETPF